MVVVKRSDEKFYAYLGDDEFGEESLKSDKIMIVDDLKTVEGVACRCMKYWVGKKFRIYRYTDFYDGSTFRRVY